MALDIRSGDLLVVATHEYSILFCGAWMHELGSTRAFKRMCRITASTKRPPAVAAGKRGDAATQIASLKCQPVDPATQSTRDLVVRDVPKAPLELFQTIVDGGDTFYLLGLEKVRKPQS